MNSRRLCIAVLGVVIVIIGYAVVSWLMTPVPSRFDQPWQSPAYSYTPSPDGKTVPGAEAGFIHSTQHGETTSLALWGNITARSGGRREVTPGYTSGRVTDSQGIVVFQWEARLKNQFEGVLSIENQEYRLSDGKLFLVAPDASPLRVLQLDRDLAGMAPMEIHDQFAEDPDVIRFFGESARRRAEQSHAPEPAAGSVSSGESSPPAR